MADSTYRDMTEEHLTYTPGPWTIDHERIGPFGEPVAMLCDMTASSPGTVVNWPRGTEVADDAENEANARLIASAPDLLEALEALVENIWLGRGLELANACATIAKAKGGKQ